ncbi:diguanylate cyclase (GGDEF) domain-containing protein [Eubacterium uniforme]|uniref:Diguanylate cyclase (GGDEF) domain-containing protein n=1 Tax=Eubacterium uniforme TaxID=39495 RepID=A0A1T4VJQ7_9FIRM|nr:GGDEF and EAL domain-containing protein [Eubacterium uniforme]SKA65200.1 diguanylate cyclase (GGDEF) domain-containing protein [Eubacterium uniforme]
MIIQERYFLLYICLIMIQLFCCIKAYKSDKPIGKYTSFVNASIILPIVGNIIIITSENKHISYLGYLLYYIGMTFVMLSLVVFTNVYCKGVDEYSKNKHSKPYFLYVLVIIDIIQLLLGDMFHHIVSLEPTMLDGKILYSDVPKVGLTFHRIADYFILVCIVLIYFISIYKTSKLYREKYVLLLIILVASAVAQFIYIQNRKIIDHAIIFHAILGGVIFYLSIIHRPLRLLDAMLSNIISDMNDAVYVFDNTHRCVWVNEQGMNLLELKDSSLKEVKDTLFEKFKNITNKGDSWTENRVVGKKYYILEKKSIKAERGKLAGSMLIIKDDTKRHLAVEREVYDSRHDSLTGIYNMKYLYSRISNQLAYTDEEYVLLYLNIKSFKLINENFGKTYGDVVLIELANWIRNNVSDGLYGRLVSDTFGICILKKDFDEDFYIRELSDFVVILKNVELRINIHIGVYEVLNRSMDVSVMFDRAHLAISNVEEKYKTVVKYYDEKIRNEMLEEQRLVSDFPVAIKYDHIIPYLQPIVDEKGKVVGAEALARWNHSEMGFLPPYKFIPLFEKNGLITQLDMYIWEQVCKILNEWKKLNLDLFISINISPKDFYFTDVVSVIVKLIKKYDIEPRKLRIEITETAMMSNPEERIDILNKFRDAGFIVEMDDFGSGYSSLNTLKDMPVDLLKIDMKFLSKDNDERANIIIKNIINLTNDLDIVSLTEGVETKEQFEGLLAMGCELFQGYYFSKPMPVEEFSSFIEKSASL